MPSSGGPVVQPNDVARGVATVLAGLLLSLALSLMLQMPGRAGLVLPVFSFGVGTSLLDVALNSEAAELELLGGRAIMSNLHGMFSVGGMAGAAAVAGLTLAELGIEEAPADVVTLPSVVTPPTRRFRMVNGCRRDNLRLYAAERGGWDGEAGFGRVSYTPMTGGIVALHSGWRI
mgnify:CR=1 FL=1